VWSLVKLLKRKEMKPGERLEPSETVVVPLTQHPLTQRMKRGLLSLGEN
jgi:hypothetical protein